MKHEEQRIAIAERCGWHRCSPYTVGRSGKQRVIYKGIHPYTSMLCELPDYLNDLNAMHEAEKVLKNQFCTLEESYWRLLACIQPHPIYATAAQRAEALLKTLSLWQE